MTIAHSILNDSQTEAAPLRAAHATSFGPTLIEAARALVPQIQALSGLMEHERRLLPSLVDALTRAGLFRMAVPRSLGGGGADPLTVARVVEELAKADGSTAWCVMLAAQVASAAGFLPEAGAVEVFGRDPAAIAAGVLRPVGRAIPVAGGYRVSGRWPFASGSSHATWFGGECVILDGENPRRDESGKLITRLFFIPREQFTVHDTWTVIGLRGTASNDVSVDDRFVPEARTYHVHVAPPRDPGPLYRALPLVYLGHGSHALGIAQAALDALISQRTATTAARCALREQTRLQAQVAEAQALIESARHYLYGAAEDLWLTVLAGDEGTAEQQARVRLAISHAARSAVQAVDLLYAAAGTAAIFDENPLDRRFRDIHTAAAHVMVGPTTFEAAGRVALGLGAGMPFF